jgi:HAD superfamily hydrolase (TIGR01484 family)
MKYIFFLDIDETIMSNGIIHPKTSDAIKRAQKEGHKVFINTGRALSIVPEIIKNLEPDGYVCAIGTYISVGDEVVLSTLMDRELVKRLMDFSKKHSVRSTIEGVNHSVSYCGLIYFDEVSSYEDMYERFPDIDVQKIVYARPLSESETEELTQYVNVFNHPTYSEANLYGFSKSRAMLEVSNRLGFTKEQTVAMGDSANDLDMLKAAGISVAMGNAIDEVKEISTLVAPPSNEGGVGYAIEKIISGDSDR